jgi:hypothetical protein
VDVITQDPADDRILECAVAAGAGFLVTADRHLLRLPCNQARCLPSFDNSPQAGVCSGPALAQPSIDFSAQGLHRTPRLPRPVDRKAKLAVPPPRRLLPDAKVAGDLLPAAQPAPGASLLRYP